MASEAHSTEPQLDREKFSTVLHLKALRLQASQCQEYVKAMSGHMLNKTRLKSVVKDPADPKSRLLLLNEKIKGEDLAGLPEELRLRVTTANLPVVDYSLHLDYSYWSADHVLKRLLPEGAEVPSSFETVGHIAHLNIREDLELYKHVIGQVILDKNTHIKTVVNKVGTINSAYRVFQMEVVAGEPRFETEVVQFKARFRLDFSKVYWNSRLEHEHLRLVANFRRDDVILDVMAGIGPFAVPAGQKGCKVFANDLNPDSHRYLDENVRLNKVGAHVTVYNMDGRCFIRELSARGGPLYSQVVMNLPASAVHFLDAFRCACADKRWSADNLPMVHCYTFSKGDETHAGVQQRVETALGGPLEEDPAIHLVREVAPNKSMLCVSFKLPAAVALPKSSGTQSGSATAQPGSVTSQPNTQSGEAAAQSNTATVRSDIVIAPSDTAPTQPDALMAQSSAQGSECAQTHMETGPSGNLTQEPLKAHLGDSDASHSVADAAAAASETNNQADPHPAKKPRTSL